MACSTNMAMGGIGMILLIIVIVVIIIAIWSRRGSDDCERDNQHRRSKSGHRFRVKTATTGDQERFEVERSRRHRRNRSRSRNSSSSSDGSNLLPGGLGDICLISGGLTTCASGLACQDQRCVCPRPLSPTVTTTTQGISAIIVTWDPVVNANFYEVILYRISGPGELGPVDVVNIEGVTTITFADLTPGTYKAEVKSGSNACGLAFDAVPGISIITIGCTLNNQCSGATPFCQAGTCVQCLVSTDCSAGQTCQNGTCSLTTGQGVLQTCLTTDNCSFGLNCIAGLCQCVPPGPVPADKISLALNPANPTSIIVTWPTVANADFYEVTLLETDPLPNSDIRVSPTQTIITPTLPPATLSATFTGLTHGGQYFAEIVTGSRSCGISGVTPPSISVSTASIPCVPFVFPSAGRVTQGLLNPDNNTRTVVLSWDPAIPTPDNYFVTIEGSTGPAPLVIINGTELIQGQVDFPAVLVTLSAGLNYTAFIFPYTATCPTITSDRLLISFSVNSTDP